MENLESEVGESSKQIQESNLSYRPTWEPIPRDGGGDIDLADYALRN